LLGGFGPLRALGFPEGEVKTCPESVLTGRFLDWRPSSAVVAVAMALLDLVATPASLKGLGAVFGELELEG